MPGNSRYTFFSFQDSSFSPSPLSPPKVHDLSSEEDDHEEGEFTIEEEHEATDSEEEEEDSGEDLYSSLTADVLHSLALSPRRSAESSGQGMSNICDTAQIKYTRLSIPVLH